MKKVISSIILFLIVVNFIFSNTNISYSATNMTQEFTETQYSPSNSVSTDILEDGSVSTTTGSSKKTPISQQSFGVTALANIAGVFARIVDVFAFTIDMLMASVSYAEEKIDGDISLKMFFTLERAVFNRISLFNVDYFTYSKLTYTVGNSSNTKVTLNTNGALEEIKTSVAKVFQVCRVLALAIGLLVFIYVGIRMALSCLAEDKAKYKKMLISWFESMILITLLPYIMSFIIYLNNIFINMFYDIEQSILNGENVFEDTVRFNVLTSCIGTSGLKATFWCIMYVILLLTEIKFFITYCKRTLMVGFLIAISPIITVTYAIDKVGDGKAQAFSIWLKEFSLNVFIQPLHAIIYMVFVLTANNIATAAPIIALLFLLSLSTVEKMVKTIFNLKDVISLGDIGYKLKKGK